MRALSCTWHTQHTNTLPKLVAVTAHQVYCQNASRSAFGKMRNNTKKKKINKPKARIDVLRSDRRWERPPACYARVAATAAHVINGFGPVDVDARERMTRRVHEYYSKQKSSSSSSSLRERKMHIYRRERSSSCIAHTISYYKSGRCWHEGPVFISLPLLLYVFYLCVLCAPFALCALDLSNTHTHIQSSKSSFSFMKFTTTKQKMDMHVSINDLMPLMNYGANTHTHELIHTDEIESCRWITADRHRRRRHNCKSI